MFDLVLKSCTIVIEDRKLPTDLILLDMYDFDVILGMDWFAAYHTNMDCLKKQVAFRHPREMDLDSFAFTKMES